ncbi:sialate O-acetylesterase [Bacillus sp. JCM 19034]|uniref:sialate O-acetylesterase n=1 Tax=Bacillus sp. JCM 19034 TaxID=1481928 RepID=UPI00078340C0|nr:sialate O-acetylesterase [Bacillus sp. JCM 19034]
MKLSSIVSDGMVLQRHSHISISGRTTPSRRVSLTFLNQTYQTISDHFGSWSIILQGLEPGGPYQMKITSDETKWINDILIGDVWLLGGQSNMELPIKRTLDLFSEEVKAVNNPHIRQFNVPLQFDFHKPHELLTGGRWCSAIGVDVMDFSAVGYFFANYLYEKYEVPIGLIQTSVGGTPIEAWISEKTLRVHGGYEAEIEQNKDNNYVTSTQQQDEQRHRDWYKQLNRQDVGLQGKPCIKNKLTQALGKTLSCQTRGKIVNLRRLEELSGFERNLSCQLLCV